MSGLGLSAEFLLSCGLFPVVGISASRTFQHLQAVLSLYIFDVGRELFHGVHQGGIPFCLGKIHRPIKADPLLEILLHAPSEILTEEEVGFTVCHNVKALFTFRGGFAVDCMFHLLLLCFFEALAFRGSIISQILPKKKDKFCPVY